MPEKRVRHSFEAELSLRTLNPDKIPDSLISLFTILYIFVYILYKQNLLNKIITLAFDSLQDRNFSLHVKKNWTNFFGHKIKKCFYSAPILYAKVFHDVSLSGYI